MIKKKTKIVATISDKRCDENFLKSLYEAGMDVVRINTAHQELKGSKKIIDNVRKVSDKIAIMIDTKGPEIRTTQAPEDIVLKAGDIIKIEGNHSKESTREFLNVTFDGFVNNLSLGNSILIDDGEIELLVIDKNDQYLTCKATNDGIIKSHKSVNVPNVHINLPALSDKDRDYILFAIENDIDFIAHSFVRCKEDILEIQKILDQHNSPIKIIAKIENQQGVDNIDNILEYAYGVMVARGDLGIEIPYERIPSIQKLLINKCIFMRKPVIVATQMLHSMITNPRPTRAEVSDIANAVYSKADALMLSGETANGCYPLEAVKTMAKVIFETEKTRSLIHHVPQLILNTDITAYLAKAAVQAAIDLNCKAIIADSITGRTIRELAAYRGKNIILARCYDKRVIRQLALSFGVYADFMEQRKFSHEFIHASLLEYLTNGELDVNDRVVIVAGNFGKSMGPSFIEISTVENLLMHDENL
jgi:pyruvate kinase